MADGETGEKTEMPTPKKLRDAREKGQVSTSKDVVSTAVLIVIFAVLAWMGPALMDDAKTLLSFISTTLGAGVPSVSQARTMAVIVVLKHSFVFVLVAALVGIVGNVAQIGFLFTFEPIMPKLEKLNPVEGAKKIFSMKNLFEFLKNVVKVLFLGYLIYKIILSSIPQLLTMCYGTVDDIFPSLKLMLKRMAVYTAFGYIVIAVADKLFQSKNFIKQMMMTKDEVKREYKEMEGSQEVKQAQKQFRQEILNGPEPAKATRDADLVVTNPTHLAVGVRYRADEFPLPRVCVMGADLIAKTIRETALEAGIPIIEDVPLARALWAEATVGDVVPESLLEPVAEVLKWAKQLERARQEEADLDAVSLEPLPETPADTGSEPDDLEELT